MEVRICNLWFDMPWLCCFACIIPLPRLKFLFERILLLREISVPPIVSSHRWTRPILDFFFPTRGSCWKEVRLGCSVTIVLETDLVSWSGGRDNHIRRYFALVFSLLCSVSSTLRLFVLPSGRVSWCKSIHSNATSFFAIHAICWLLRGILQTKKAAWFRFKTHLRPIFLVNDLIAVSFRSRLTLYQTWNCWSVWLVWYLRTF